MGSLIWFFFLLEPGCPWRPNLFWGFKSSQLAKEEARSQPEAMPASHFNWGVFSPEQEVPKVLNIPCCAHGNEGRVLTRCLGLPTPNPQAPTALLAARSWEAWGALNSGR